MRGAARLGRHSPRASRARVLHHRKGGLPACRPRSRPNHQPSADAQPWTRLVPVIERRIGGGRCGRRGCRRPWLRRDRIVAMPGRIVRPRHPQPDERPHPQRRAGRSAIERHLARLRPRPPRGGPRDGVRRARGCDGRPFRRSVEGRPSRPRPGDGVRRRPVVRRRHASSWSAARVARPRRRARLAGALDHLWREHVAVLGVAAGATRPPMIAWVSDRLGRRCSEAARRPVFELRSAPPHDRTTMCARRTRTIEQAVAPLAEWWDDFDVLLTPSTFQPAWPSAAAQGRGELGTLAAPFSLAHSRRSPSRAGWSADGLPHRCATRRASRRNDELCSSPGPKRSRVTSGSGGSTRSRASVLTAKHRVRGRRTMPRPIAHSVSVRRLAPRDRRRRRSPR